MMDERKERAINYLIQGEQITNTAKLIGVSRTAIYNWLDDEEFKNELDKRTREIKTQGNRIILGKLTACIDELLTIALSDDVSVKVKSDTAQYLVNRVLGTPTNKIEQTTQDKETDKTTEDDILTAIDAVKDHDKE